MVSTQTEPPKTRYIYENVRLLRVIDADTFELVVDEGFTDFRIRRLDPLQGWSYRLSRVQAPEKRTAAGVAAILAVIELLASSHPRLKIETLKVPDAFGRYLVELFVWRDDGWLNVNDWLLTSGHAVLY